MNWIRVSVDMPEDPKFGRIAVACRISTDESLAKVLRVLCKLPAHAREGHLADVPDVILEEWARWNGKRGVFASAFRKEFCTNEGVVSAWERHNGAAIREADRQRKNSQNYRNRHRENTGDVTGDVTGDEHAYEHGRKIVDGTGRDVEASITQEVEGTPLAPARADATPPPPLLDEVADWIAPRGHDAARLLFAHVPDVQAWVGILRGLASGLSMDQHRPCDAERLAVAVEDFVAKGKHRERGGPSPKLFRSFVRTARAPVKHYAGQQSEAEYKAEQLLALRRQNVRRRSMGQPEKALPAWASDIDAQFPDGRTFPVGNAA